VLIVSAIDVADVAFAIDDQRRRVRDVQRIHPYQVIQPITFGNYSVLIQKKGKGYGMLFQKLGRFEEPIPLFRGNEGQFRARLRNLFLDRLDPSQALDAIRSPCPA
jgi:hypothetical protein